MNKHRHAKPVNRSAEHQREASMRLSRGGARSTTGEDSSFPASSSQSTSRRDTNGTNSVKFKVGTKEGLRMNQFSKEFYNRLDKDFDKRK